MRVGTAPTNQTTIARQHVVCRRVRNGNLCARSVVSNAKGALVGGVTVGAVTECQVNASPRGSVTAPVGGACKWVGNAVRR